MPPAEVKPLYPVLPCMLTATTIHERDDMRLELDISGDIREKLIMIGKQVLIIDDDQDIRKVLKISLQMIANWDVLTAASGQEGLLIAQAEQPDAILLNVIPPEMNEIEISQQIQANAKIQHISVILLTTTFHAVDRLQFSKLPIAGVIIKPFKATDLVKQMRSILDWND